tara:strand:- start:818 stop:1990 length:1173 start_codon:yes stop_codon:yes gene_type:complete
MIEWQEYKLNEIGQVVGGGTPSSTVKTYWGGDVSWITPADLSGYQFKHIGNGSKNITELGLKKSSAKLHPKNTVLMTSRAPIGYLAIADKPLATNQGFQSIRCNEDIADFNFIYYLLSAYKEGIALIASGATFPEVSNGKVKQYKIKLPPLPTQKKIAKILSKYDDLIENNLKRINLLEESVRLTYEEWFLRFRVEGKKLEINPTTGLPFGWELAKIGSLLKPVKATTKIKSTEIKETGETAVIDQSIDFIAGYTNETNINQYKDNAFIVFGDHTRILKYINFSFAKGADGTQILISNNTRMPQVLFYQSLIAINISNYHYARHFKFLKALKIILPDESTAVKFSNKYEMYFDEIKNLRNQNRLLKEARDILLPRLVTGKIDTDKIDTVI